MTPDVPRCRAGKAAARATFGLLATLAALAIALPPLTARAWQQPDTIDAMTDAPAPRAYLDAPSGERFVIERRDNDSVWGALELPPDDQFGVGGKLTLRIDGDKPQTFDGNAEDLAARIGIDWALWEWAPQRIAVHLWRGDADQGCGDLRRLHDGQRLTARYQPAQGPARDVVFALDRHREVLSRAVGTDLANCRE